MKSINYLTLFIVIPAICENLDLAEAAVMNEQRNIVTPAFQNPVHKEDASSGAFTVKSSGRYYLAEDFITILSSGSFLTVSADNVTVNLNTKAIVPHPSAGTSLTGITISAGISNAQVMNGTIQSLDMGGSTQHLNNGLTVASASTNYTIKLSDLFVNRVKATAFSISLANDVSVEKCSGSNGTGSNCAGLSLTTVSNFVVKDCEFNNNTSSGGGVNGIVTSGATDGVIENCLVSSNSGVGASYGLQLASTSTNVHCKNVVASSNSTSTSGVCVGIQVASNSCRLTNCRANNNSSSSDEGIGIEVTGDNCQLSHCLANNNSSSAAATAGYGFKVSSDNNALLDCSSNNNTASGGSVGAIAYGFYFTSANENRCVNCTANKNTSTNFAAYGFYLTTASNDNAFEGCKAIGNTASAASQVAAGFYSTANSTNLFQNCIANAQSANTQGKAAGFWFNQAETRSQLIGCEAVSNAASSHANSRGYGVYFEASSGTGPDNCVMRNCYLAYNSGGASGRAFGFYDDDTASTVLLLGNTSAGHGQCLGGTLDASLQWSDSEPSSSQNYYFKHAGTGADPRNVIQEVPTHALTSLSTAVRQWQNVSLYS